MPNGVAYCVRACACGPFRIVCIAGRRRDGISTREILKRASGSSPSSMRERMDVHGNKSAGTSTALESQAFGNGYLASGFESAEEISQLFVPR